MLCLLFSIFLICSLWHTVSSQDIQPSCFTDYDSEVICSWEVDASTDCSEKFRLHVSTTHIFDGPGPSGVCSPKNKRGHNETPKCACSIRSKVLHNYEYHFSLEANGEEIWKMSEDLDKMVKPRPPVYLAVTRKDDFYTFTWADDYKEGDILHENPKTTYEFAYWPLGREDKVLKTIETKRQHTISYHDILSGAIFIARVRQEWGGVWSDWSPVCSFVTTANEDDKFEGCI